VDRGLHLGQRERSGEKKYLMHLGEKAEGHGWGVGELRQAGHGA